MLVLDQDPWWKDKTHFGGTGSSRWLDEIGQSTSSHSFRWGIGLSLSTESLVGGEGGGAGWAWVDDHDHTYSDVRSNISRVRQVHSPTWQCCA